MTHTGEMKMTEPMSRDTGGAQRAVLAALRAAGDRALARQVGLRRRHEAGMTLVEVLIVVSIMALIATGVTVFALPKFKEAQVSTAKTNAQVLRRAVQDWQRVNMESTCPTISQLIEGKHLDSASNTDDPWGQPWAMVCTDDDIFVQSMGPDKKQGTPDDISVPQIRTADDS
jgi:general secretion pathway protein G